ncbi:uncharacterized protein LOC135223688 [Macrobrachium nipponense]|uniref:uncharacterized protein LOC135223688 n=1 Tax=Macrobrachium nipponense TaxID=159736 RepID=UPI0030C89E2B
MLRESIGLLREGNMLGEGMDESAGDHFLAGEVCFPGKAAPQATPVFHSRQLEEQERLRRNFENLSVGRRPFEVVVRSRQAIGRTVPQTSEPRSSVVLRRVHDRLGSNTGGEGSVRPLERGTEVLAHKPQGIGSNSIGSPILREKNYGTDCPDQLGQHHGSRIYQETGRDSLSVPVRDSERYLALGENEKYNDPDKIRFRSAERSCRPSQPSTSAASNRMDSPSRGLPRVVEALGTPISRPLRDIEDEEASDLLLPGSRPRSNSYRCHAMELEGDGCLRLFSIQTPGRSDQEVCGFRRSKNDADRPLLACKRLVRRGHVISGRLPKDPTRKNRSTQTAPLREVSQKPLRSESDCIQTIEK